MLNSSQIVAKIDYLIKIISYKSYLCQERLLLNLTFSA